MSATGLFPFAHPAVVRTDPGSERATYHPLG